MAAWRGGRGAAQERTRRSWALKGGVQGEVEGSQGWAGSEQGAAQSAGAGAWALCDSLGSSDPLSLQ